MPNVYLKNEVGEDIEYDDIDSVTLRRVEGGTATYTFGNPQTTDAWKMMESIISGDSRTTLFTKNILATPSGKLIAFSEPGFGTWFQSLNDAWRISTVYMPQMYTVPGGVILSSNVTGSKICLWKDTEKELEELLPTGSTIYNFREYAGKYFISTYLAWYLFDAETKEMTPILTGNSSMGAYCLDTGEELLLSVTASSPNPRGIYRLDPNTFELTQIYNEGGYWLGSFRSSTGLKENAPLVAELEDGYLFSGASGSSGVLYYNKLTKVVTKIVATGYQYFNETNQTRYAYGTYTRIIPGHGIAFSSTQAASWGTWYYDFESKEATQICDNGYMSSWIENEDTVTGTYSYFGVVVYDKANRRWYRPATSGQYDNSLIFANGILLGGSNSGIGLRFYDFETQTLTVLNSTMAGWRYMIKVDGGALLSNTASGCGVWFFDETEKTISQIATIGHEWYMVKWHDSVLLGSFNSSVYGWYFYKNGVITYNAGFNSNTRCMRCISVVEDGWVVSSYNYSSPVAFIDGDTGEAKNLGISVNQVGPYMPNWYGPNTSWKPTYDYNRKFGRYRVLSSYDGNGCIFDDIAHEVLPLVYWYNGSELPSTTTAKSTSLRRVAFIELDNNTVLIVSGYSSNSNCVTLNYSTGTAYLWQNLSLYVNNEANYWFTPLDEEIPVSDGLLIYIKPFDYSEYPAMLTSAAGVWHYYPTTGRLDRIYSSGYYDTKEDAPGGFYLYLSSLPQINRLYWNEETHTLTKIDY